MEKRGRNQKNKPTPLSGNLAEMFPSVFSNSGKPSDASKKVEADPATPQTPEQEATIKRKSPKEEEDAALFVDRANDPIFKDIDRQMSRVPRRGGGEKFRPLGR